MQSAIYSTATENVRMTFISRERRREKIFYSYISDSKNAHIYVILLLLQHVKRTMTPPGTHISNAIEGGRTECHNSILEDKHDQIWPPPTLHGDNRPRSEYSSVCRSDLIDDKTINFLSVSY